EPWAALEDELFDLVTRPLDDAGDAGVQGSLGGHRVEPEAAHELGFAALALDFERGDAGWRGAPALGHDLSAQEGVGHGFALAAKDVGVVGRPGDGCERTHALLLRDHLAQGQEWYVENVEGVGPKGGRVARALRPRVHDNDRFAMCDRRQER